MKISVKNIIILFIIIFFSQTNSIAQKITKPITSLAEVSNFCNFTAKAGQAIYWRARTEETLTDEKLAQYLLDPYKASQLWVKDAWTASLYPSFVARKIGFNLQISSQCIRDSTYHDEQSFIRFLQIPHAQLNYIAPNYFDIDSFKNGGNKSQESDIKASLLSKYALCATYGLFQAGDCVKALNEIVDLMAPVTNITALPILKEVLADSKYGDGLALTALKIIQKIKLNTTSGTHLYDDLYQSFIDIGLTNNAAENYTWNVLAVYSARGPNMNLYSFFAKPETSRTILSLAIIASGINVLDSLSLSSKKLYSMPKEITTGCDFGKPYHFWLPAFLARKFGKELNNSDAAMYASYLSAIGYQMKSKTQDRYPNRAFMTKAFGLANNKIRLDLAFASAGAVYGRNLVNGRHDDLNIDQGLLEMINDGQDLPVISLQESEDLFKQNLGIESYFRWKKIFAPDSSLYKHLSPSH